MGSLSFVVPRKPRSRPVIALALSIVNFDVVGLTTQRCSYGELVHRSGDYSGVSVDILRSRSFAVRRSARWAREVGLPTQLGFFEHFAPAHYMLVVLFRIVFDYFSI